MNQNEFKVLFPHSTREIRADETHFKVREAQWSGKMSPTMVGRRRNFFILEALTQSFKRVKIQLYLNTLNFRVPFIFAQRICAKIKGCVKKPIFAHLDARKFKGTRNSTTARPARLHV